MNMHPKIKKMVDGMQRIQRMQRKRRFSKYKKDEKWFLYILECKNGTFYTGVTNNIQRRLKMHNEGKASRYTRTWRPVKLVYQESCKGRTKALVRECQVKALSRKKKEMLVGLRSKTKKKRSRQNV